jgi:protein CpxP
MSRRNNLILSTFFCLASSALALAQGPMGPGPMGQGPGLMGTDRPPMERVFHDGHFGRWWNDPRLSQQLALTDDQKHRMDDIFLQHRLRLIDLDAALEKQQVLLRPMIEADQPDEGKVLSQIDSIAQARAELEKANARMLFDIRKTLTADQWKKLKALREERRPGLRRRPGDRPGPGEQGEWHHENAPAPPDGGGPGADGGPIPPTSNGAPAAPPQ